MAHRGNRVTEKARSYWEASRALRRELGRTLPREELKALHRKRPARHFAVAAGLLLVTFACLAGLTVLGAWWQWIPLSVVLGFCYFDFTVLLHEVVHNAVFATPRPRLQQWLGWLYAIFSGISAAQFTRWHLDHHDNLGDGIDDPKRHWLSPKRGTRREKLLYWTPLLIPIYFRAARKESEVYDPKLRRRIARERAATLIVHLGVVIALFFGGGFPLVVRGWLIPYFLVFPVAFSLNRVGQHYAIDPSDPARWSTRVDGNRLWRWIFLESNFHLEHHYFQNVPFYHLPRLNRLLRPFYRERGIPNLGYLQILRGWLIDNETPHTRWRGDRSA